MTQHSTSYSFLHGHIVFRVIGVDALFAIFSRGQKGNPNYTRQYWKKYNKISQTVNLKTEKNRHIQTEMSRLYLCLNDKILQLRYSLQLIMQTLSMQCCITILPLCSCRQRWKACTANQEKVANMKQCMEAAMSLQPMEFFSFATQLLIRKVKFSRNIASTRWMKIFVPSLALVFL